MTTLATTDRDRTLNNVFTTAMEGGVNYWASVVQYRWSDGAPHYNEINEFRAVLRDVQEDDLPEYVVDRAVIAKGIRLLYAHMKDLGENANRYHKEAVTNLQFGRYDDADYDSDTADMIVQFGLFEKLVYG